MTSAAMRPILRVGFSALMAYWGTTEMAWKRCRSMASLSADGQLRAVQLDAAAHVAHAAVEADEAVAEGRLAAARFAGQAHDLAVGDVEADAVEGVDVPGEGGVVDPQVPDLQRHVATASAAAG